MATRREIATCRSTLATFGRRSTVGGCEQGAEAEQLRHESTELRKLVADLSLDKEELQFDRKKRLGLVALKTARGELAD
jgi:hypothetical protein